LIVLDLSDFKYIKKIELLKLILHSIKCCFFFNWSLTVKTGSKYIKITPTFLQKILRRNLRIVIVLKPFSRLNLLNLEKLQELSFKINKPTIIISDLIYQHLSVKLSYIHLPEYSPELIKKIDYTKDIGIYICLDHWRDYEKVNLNNEEHQKIDVKKISIPLKTIKKFHPYSDSAEILERINGNIDYEPVENLSGQKLSVVIPSKLEYMVETKFYGLTSSCSMVIEQITKHLKSLMIEFEIIVVVGPDVNQENLRIALSRDTKFINIADEKDFNFSRRVNLGSQAAQHDLIWLINDDVEIIDDSSTLKDIRTAIELVNRKSTGFVGTFLLDSEKVINHAGIKIYGEIADHYLRGTPYHNVQAMNLFKVREVIGVTGANMFFSNNQIKKLGLWDESYPNNFNDLEISLRAKEQGLQNYVIRTSNFIHFESKTRNAKILETEKLITILNQYGVKADEDPYKFTIPNCCL
jgi:GT2 family glycosyltransferase